MPAGMTGTRRCCSAAARYLAETRNFDGTVHFIFQPAEEGGGGGRVMVEEGLFDRFPCDAVYALHNDPELPLGEAPRRSRPGAGRGRPRDHHGAWQGRPCLPPHTCIDPVLVGAQIVVAAQSIVSRSMDPLDCRRAEPLPVPRRFGRQRDPRDRGAERHRANLQARGAGHGRGAPARHRARDRGSPWRAGPNSPSSAAIRPR